MKIKSLKCPECGANLEIEEGRSFCFCQYCGCKIMLDEEKHEYTYNENVNKTININKNIHKRYTDDADVIRVNSQSGKGGIGYLIEQNYGYILMIVFLMSRNLNCCRKNGT